MDSPSLKPGSIILLLKISSTIKVFEAEMRTLCLTQAMRDLT